MHEVLKHDTVEQVVLCDIDEVIIIFFCCSNCFDDHPTCQAVIQVSKLSLPHMSSLLASPKVTVHISNGFKFLTANESTLWCDHYLFFGPCQTCWISLQKTVLPTPSQHTHDTSPPKESPCGFTSDSFKNWCKHFIVYLQFPSTPIQLSPHTLCYDTLFTFTFTLNIWTLLDLIL